MSGRSTRRRSELPPDILLTTPEFFGQANREVRLDSLTHLFKARIEAESVHSHHCFRLVMGSHLFPLFGDAPDHGPLLAKRFEFIDDFGRESPAIELHSQDQGLIVAFPVRFPMGDPLVVSLGFERGVTGNISRPIRARLCGLATIYAMKGLPLWEIEEDVETIVPLTLKERIVFAMTLAGYSNVAIAEKLQCSMGAVVVHIGNATAKLEVEDYTEAVSIAARRGWLHVPDDFGIDNKELYR